MPCQVRLLKIGPRIRNRVNDEKGGKPKQVGRPCDMRRAFPEFSADRFFTLFVMRPKIGRKSAYTLRGNFQHDGCDQQKQASAELSGERACDKATSNPTN